MIDFFLVVANDGKYMLVANIHSDKELCQMVRDGRAVAFQCTSESEVTVSKVRVNKGMEFDKWHE